ncbi:macoilin 1 [Trichuris trichiura]|uniref:Macoilin n=1 Tax=Trichuris trichiura TaxID=36087 RepID=A0A077YVS4_TRITR|nr:macoilin 1 [Trichuris trichiura]
MKRRNIDSAKLRRTLKRNRMSEGLCGSSLVYLKLLMVWAFVMMADFLLDLRFEYIWPFWLMLRSIYDSFRYQGMTFSFFFICVTFTSDMICFIFVPVQWIFFIASTYVWVQYVWHADRGICLPTTTLWLLFIYFEASVRLKELKSLPFTLDLCRPFAAHCIGYPVVTLGFGVKSYVSYRLRLRKQREVKRENQTFVQLLRAALPVPDGGPYCTADEATPACNGALQNGGALVCYPNASNFQIVPKGSSSSSSSSSKVANNVVGGNNSVPKSRGFLAKAPVESNSEKPMPVEIREVERFNFSHWTSRFFWSSVGHFVSAVASWFFSRSRSIAPSSCDPPTELDAQPDEAMTIAIQCPSLVKTLQQQQQQQQQQSIGPVPTPTQASESAASAPTTNPVVAVHNRRNRKKGAAFGTTTSHTGQGSVVAKRDADLSPTGITKETHTSWSSHRSCPKEQSADAAAAAALEIEMDKLRADLRACKSKEYELRLQVQQLLATEKSTKGELSNFKFLHDQLQNRVQSLMRSKAQDKSNMQAMEKQVAEANKAREKAERQLQQERRASKRREDAVRQQAIASALSSRCHDDEPSYIFSLSKFCRLECEYCKRRRELEKEMKQLRKELITRDEHIREMDEQLESLRSYKESNDFEALAGVVAAMESKNNHLEESLSSETRIKLDLFSALGDARRQHEITQGTLCTGLLQAKEEEVERLSRRVKELSTLVGGVSAAGNVPNSQATGCYPAQSPSPVDSANLYDRQRVLVASAMTGANVYQPNYVNPMAGYVFDSVCSSAYRGAPLMHNGGGGSPIGGNGSMDRPPSMYSPALGHRHLHHH